MDKQFIALTYVLTDIRVHLFTLINLLVEKNVIDADEYYAMQKKCEVSEGAQALKEIQRLLSTAKRDGDVA